jgi:hypothetical protein
MEKRKFMEFMQEVQKLVKLLQQYERAPTPYLKKEVVNQGREFYAYLSKADDEMVFLYAKGVCEGVGYAESYASHFENILKKKNPEYIS